MTYGIDIAAYQLGLDISDAVDAGNEFVGVKAIAAFRPELTVAAGYHDNIDRVIAAGLDNAKFHYTVPNNQNTPEATAQATMLNVYRRAETDAFMLDNEPLDSYPVFWGDDDAARYFYKQRELGVFFSQMWLYCPAARTRAAGAWPKIAELRKVGLKIVWVSYGDNDPYLEDGEEPNTGSTGLDNPDVHQFTSTYRIPGYAGNVDRNYSRHPVHVLFNGGMDMAYNPFANMRITGTWRDHASYSAGGTDLPTSYGTAIRAPAAGTLQVSGGSGEWATGWVGSAGRRSILHLDRPLPRVIAKAPSPPEGDGPMVAIVFQHQSAFGSPGWHAETATCGRTGASANGSDHGGDVHLHWHGLNARGQRLRIESFITGSGSTAGGGGIIIPGDKPIEIDYALLRRQKEESMYVRGETELTTIYNVYTDTKGKPRLRLCGKNEAAYAINGGLVVKGDNATLTALGLEAMYGKADTSLYDAIWLEAVVTRQNTDGSPYVVSTLQELADAKSNTMELLAKPAADLTEEQIKSIIDGLSNVTGASPAQVEEIVNTALANLQLSTTTP